MSLSGWGIAVVSPEHKGHAINPGEQVGTAMLLGGGYLSSYHAFQTAAYTRKKLGEYAFLPNEPESPRDLALAPFQVSYFAKPRVSLWLASVAGFLAYANKQDKLFKDYEKNRPDAGSYLTSFVSSSLTGVGEEALFRGYLMPLIRQKSGSDTWALWGQAGLFIPLHSGGNLLVSIPYAFYSGYIVQDNNYRLSEAVFAHAWMNTLGSIFQYYRLDKKKQQSAYITLPPLTVPM
jgi:membrane protease YdiL (CAAX protease family)